MTELSTSERRWNSAAVAVILLLITLAWIHFVKIQPLAPPDFYRYHAESESLWRGESGILRLPPLYPMISGTVGRLLSFVMPRREAFILGGKLLSLLSVLWIFFSARGLIERVSRQFATVWAGILLLSPLVLKFIAFPLTDLPFLALFLGAVNALFHQRIRTAVVLALSSAGIRFEGLLLLGLILLFTLPWRKRKIFYLLPVLTLLLVDLFYLAARITPRLLHYLENWLLGRAPLLWEKPLFLVHVIMKNILFFLPAQWPRELHLVLAVVTALCLAAGVVVIWRWNFRYALVLICFVVGILTFKGYILFEGDWRLHTRRLLPVFVSLWVLIGLGAGVLAGFLKRVTKLRVPIQWFLLLSGVVLVFLSVGGRFWWPALILFPVAGYVLRLYSSWRTADIVKAFLVTLILFSLSGIGFLQSLPLVKAMPNPGGKAVARWLNLSGQSETRRILLFSHPEMIRFYLERPAQWEQWKVKHWTGSIPLERYWRRFMARVQKEKIDLIIMDRYMPGISDRKHVSLKYLIWRRYRNPRYFRRVRPIIWKGRMRALILTPMKGGDRGW